MRVCEADECDGGKVRSFEDRWSHHSGHYTVDAWDDCEECGGTGFVEDEEDEDGSDEDS